MGVPEGLDCTGSTVTEPPRSGAACAAPQAEKPAGAAREKLRRATIERNSAVKAFPSLFNGRRGKKLEVPAHGNDKIAIKNNRGSGCRMKQ